jgi:hypothetical protein
VVVKDNCNFFGYLFPFPLASFILQITLLGEEDDKTYPLAFLFLELIDATPDPSQKAH